MTITHKFWRSAAPYLFGVIGLALVTLICFRLRFGLATTSLLYLIVIVLLSLKGSFISSAVAFVLAVGCLDYFFTAPLFTFGKNDFPNVVAITVFLITSLVITRLVSRVRKQSEEALSSVSYRVIEAEEQERQRIAMELHEGIGQRVTLLALGIEQLERDSLNAVDVPSGIDALRKQTLEILTSVKTLAHELYSPRLEYLGIADVMRSFCRDLCEEKRLEIDFRSDGVPNVVPQDVTLCLLPVLQEALHNAVKHSGVRQFDVQLKGTSDGIHLTVSDCGAGFDLETAKQARGLGLHRLQERLKLVKGSFFIDSQPKRGTTIHARVPLSIGTDSMRVAGRQLS
jgi:signal transduction histidine kinase